MSERVCAVDSERVNECVLWTVNGTFTATLRIAIHPDTALATDCVFAAK